MADDRHETGDGREEIDALWRRYFPGAKVSSTADSEDADRLWCARLMCDQTVLSVQLVRKGDCWWTSSGALEAGQTVWQSQSTRSHSADDALKSLRSLMVAACTTARHAVPSPAHRWCEVARWALGAQTADQALERVRALDPLASAASIIAVRAPMVWDWSQRLRGMRDTLETSLLTESAGANSAPEDVADAYVDASRSLAAAAADLATLAEALDRRERQ